MASYISIPRDLAKVKTKVMFNLTKRQLICFGLGGLCGLPVFFISKFLVGAKTSSCLSAMIVIMIPFFLFAMFEKNGQPLEVILKQMIQLRFVRAKVRPYETNNYYRCLERQADAEREVNAIVHKKKRGKAVPKDSTGAHKGRTEAGKGNNRKSTKKQQNA